MPGASVSKLSIRNEGDWQQLVARNAVTVLDPMVFRAGEIFMRGIGDARAWDFLDKNLLALGFFFDALILNEQLPLFNYGDTFDMRLNFEERSFAMFHEAGDAIFEPVDVTWDVYHPIKNEMLTKLRERLAGGVPNAAPWISKQDAQAVISELSHAEFQWDLNLGPELEAILKDDTERRLARFLIGGMIFGEYADRLQSEHWLQPKRASLFVKAAFGSSAPGRDDERKLFDWLATHYQLPMLSMAQPTFLAYILDKAERRRDIPLIVHKLRKSSAVKDYRSWRSDAVAEWRINGGLSEKSLQTVSRLKNALSSSGNVYPASAEAAVAVVGAATAPSPDRLADAAAKSIPLFGPLLNHLPGRRHVKLLAESSHARDRFPMIERKIRTLWTEQ